MEAGNLVQLKSGGPIMTVRWVNEHKVFCDWFDDSNALKNSQFTAAQLKYLKEDE